MERVEAGEKNKKLYDFLHSKGYTALTIPQLTPIEINNLIEGHNLNVKDEMKAQKAAARKGKGKKW